MVSCTINVDKWCVGEITKQFRSINNSVFVETSIVVAKQSGRQFSDNLTHRPDFMQPPAKLATKTSHTANSNIAAYRITIDRSIDVHTTHAQKNDALSRRYCQSAGNEAFIDRNTYTHTRGMYAPLTLRNYYGRNCKTSIACERKCWRCISHTLIDNSYGERWREWLVINVINAASVQMIKSSTSKSTASKERNSCHAE